MTKWWPEIQRESQAVLSRSTIHGVTHVYKARTQQTRFFWLVLCLAGVAGFAANLIFIVERYYNNPVLTTYIPNYDEFVWPDITFCNPSAPIPFTEHPHLLKEWEELLANASAKFGDMNTHPDDMPGLIYALSTMSPHHYKINRVPHLLRQWGIDLGYDKIDQSIEFQNNMIALPTQEEKIYPFSQTTMHLRYPFVCQTFQLSRLAQLKDHKNTPRKTRQLSFFVDTDFNSYNLFNSDYVMRGVFLHMTLPNWLPQDDGYMILPSYNNLVKVKMTRTKYLVGKRHCRTTHFTLRIYTPLLNGEYRTYNGSKTDCKRYHSQLLYYLNCGCYNPFLPLYVMPENKRPISKPPNICYNMSLYTEKQVRKNFKCVNETSVRYQAGDDFSSLVENHCGEFIHPECESLSYTINMKADMWIEVWTGEMNERRSQFIDFLLPLLFPTTYKNRSRLDIKRNIAFVSMHRHSAFGDLVKEENEYPLSELISDIGGLMGLWMGLSVVGLFELVELFCKVLAFATCMSSNSSAADNCSTTESVVKENYRRQTLPATSDRMDSIIGQRQAALYPSIRRFGSMPTSNLLPSDNTTTAEVDLRYGDVVSSTPTFDGEESSCIPFTTLPDTQDSSETTKNTRTCPNGNTRSNRGYIEFLYAL